MELPEFHKDHPKALAHWSKGITLVLFYGFLWLAALVLVYIWLLAHRNSGSEIVLLLLPILIWPPLLSSSVLLNLRSSVSAHNLVIGNVNIEASEIKLIVISEWDSIIHLGQTVFWISNVGLDLNILSKWIERQLTLPSSLLEVERQWYLSDWRYHLARTFLPVLYLMCVSLSGIAWISSYHTPDHIVHAVLFLSLFNWFAVVQVIGSLALKRGIALAIWLSLAAPFVLMPIVVGFRSHYDLDMVVKQDVIAAVVLIAIGLSAKLQVKSRATALIRLDDLMKP